MSFPVYHVNAFSEHFFTGNQAAVILVDEFLPDNSLQALAKEIGFSETVYVKRLGFGKYAIRWFTPEVEVNLCGHGTLAAAKVLFLDVIPTEKKIIFVSRSGELIATRMADLITLDFPADDPVVVSGEDAILDALSKYKAEVVLYAPVTKYLIVVYQDTDMVRQLKPDFTMLKKCVSEHVYGVTITAIGHDHYDYVCRHFAPWEGINEDPVTGSAQTSLAIYWQRRFNKAVLQGFQASQRSGEFTCEVIADRVLISGKAFIYLKGEIKRGF
jgi:PhzF family phenazine biosynthesis protein